MKKFILLSITLVTCVQLFCCTTFSFMNSKGEIVFGRNFDFPTGIGHIHINNRGINKVNFIRGEKLFSWKSKYGSVTFNQNGKEFPYGGINEKGLVIEQMWLQESKYPQQDSRPALSELQWIQYQLDNSSSIQDIIESDSLVRISSNSVATLHFLAADRFGNVASIEFLEGKMVVNTGENLKYPVLANCTYQTSIDYKKSKDKKEGRAFSGWTENSSGRFSTAADMIENYNNQKIIPYAISILDSVHQKGSTQWSIVYDITNLSIHLKTSTNNTLRTLNLNGIDFCSNENMRYLDIDFDGIFQNNIKTLSYEDNYNTIKAVTQKVDFLKANIPEEAIVATARFPFELLKPNSK